MPPALPRAAIVDDTEFEPFPSPETAEVIWKEAVAQIVSRHMKIQGAELVHAWSVGELVFDMTRRPARYGHKTLNDLSRSLFEAGLRQYSDRSLRAFRAFREAYSREALKRLHRPDRRPPAWRDVVNLLLPLSEEKDRIEMEKLLALLGADPDALMAKRDEMIGLAAKDLGGDIPVLGAPVTVRVRMVNDEADRMERCLLQLEESFNGAGREMLKRPDMAKRLAETREKLGKLSALVDRIGRRLGKGGRR